MAIKINWKNLQKRIINWVEVQKVMCNWVRIRPSVQLDYYYNFANAGGTNQMEADRWVFYRWGWGDPTGSWEFWAKWIHNTDWGWDTKFWWFSQSNIDCSTASIITLHSNCYSTSEQWNGGYSIYIHNSVANNNAWWELMSQWSSGYNGYSLMTPVLTQRDRVRVPEGHYGVTIIFDLDGLTASMELINKEWDMTYDWITFALTSENISLIRGCDSLYVGFDNLWMRVEDIHLTIE